MRGSREEIGIRLGEQTWLEDFPISSLFFFLQTFTNICKSMVTISFVFRHYDRVEDL